MNLVNSDLPLIAFKDPASLSPFLVVNDGVMGGISVSRVSYAEGSLLFDGVVSLEHNGGFASFRGPIAIPGQAEALVVALRGDGKRYKFMLKPRSAAANWQYQSPFQSDGDWQTLRFEPASFYASSRGRRVKAPALEFGQVGSVGVLISDGQAGPFRLEIREIRAE
jgi:monofunctional biosynthetic peptidoglycan transglycosylase